jgi:hypothetical protein
MTALLFVHQLSLSDFQAWFQAKVARLHQARRPVHHAMGQQLRYAIEHCESDDMMPADTRMQLQEIRLLTTLGNAVEAPQTYADGARFLRDCLQHDPRADDSALKRQYMLEEVGRWQGGRFPQFNDGAFYRWFHEHIHDADKIIGTRASSPKRPAQPPSRT